MTNKKSSFLIKFIILSTLVLAFILVLLGIIFNNYSSSKDNKELINIVQINKVLNLLLWNLRI